MTDSAIEAANAEHFAAIKAQFEREYDFLTAFERNARRFARKIAVSDPVQERELTYAELNEEANKLANALRADGLQKGDVLSVVMFNSIEFVVCYLASEKVGSIFNPLNYNWSEDEVAYAFDDSRPKAVIYDAELSALVVKAFERGRERGTYLPEKTFVIGDLVDNPLESRDFGTYFAYASSEQLERPADVSIFDEIVRLYTSGTTGRAKGVPLSRFNEAMSTHEVAMRYPIFSDDVTINTTPWFHRGGFHGGMTPTLHLGGEIVILRQFNATTCLKNVQKRQVTILLGVPSAAVMVARKQEKIQAEVKSVRLLVMMGSDLEKATYRYLQSMFPKVDFINSYGTTEAFLSTFLDSKDLPEKAGTAGRASIDDDVLLVEPVEDGWGDPKVLTPKDGRTLGEVIVRCSSKTTGGYYNKPEETAKKFRGGYLYTGDLAIWDADEYISIVGRKDDMMISAGENIYPQPIEEAICKHPKVSDCIVVPVAEMTRGQALCAYVVRSDDSLDVRELLKFCSESSSLSAFTTPRYYRFVDELPYTSTGKKRRVVLRQQAPTDLKEGALARN
ncbi:MAG: acyl--CoA ligase [Thermoguttaceae bacterium]|nr:acyl--CoA ligase [Thermoguttaceae bacterium]